MSLDKAQRYHRIAQACIKAINAYTQQDQDPKAAVQAAYDAIESAFEHENQLLLTELQGYRDTLELIAAAPDSCNQDDLKQMAQTVLTPKQGH